jgi:ribonuclease HI
MVYFGRGENLAMKKYEAYTDGGWDYKNNCAGSYAAIIIREDKSEVSLCSTKALFNTTNNQMELLAVLKVLHFISVEEKEKASVTIYTDSQNVIGWCSLGWKRNTPGLIPFLEEIDKMMTKVDVKFVKVKGHSDNIYNNKVDRLCSNVIKAARQPRSCFVT